MRVKDTCLNMTETFEAFRSGLVKGQSRDPGVSCALKSTGDNARMCKKSNILCYILGGSWDLVTRVIIKVTVLIITYNPT